MNNRKKISLSLVLIISFFTFFQKAEAADLKSAAKSLDSSLNDLIQAKDDSSSQNKLSEEEDIAYRKKIILSAINLSFKEISSLEEKLKGLSLEEKSDSFVIRTKMLDFLKSADAYYKEAEKNLDGSKVSLEKIKDLAKSIKEYRDGSYDPEVLKMLDFVVIFQTERLIGNTNDRWDKIDSDIKKLDKANLIDAADFAKDMNSAKEGINSAKTLVSKAKTIFIEANKPKEAASVKNEEKIAEDSPTPKELCETALVNLKSSYDYFVKTSSGVKKSLKI